MFEISHQLLYVLLGYIVLSKHSDTPQGQAVERLAYRLSAIENGQRQQAAINFLVYFVLLLVRSRIYYINKTGLLRLYHRAIAHMTNTTVPR